MTSWGDCGIPQQELARSQHPAKPWSVAKTIRRQFIAAAKAITGPRIEGRRHRERDRLGGLFKRLAAQVLCRCAARATQPEASENWESLAWLRIWDWHERVIDPCQSDGLSEPERPNGPEAGSHIGSFNLH
jgi:hypothetical protein